MDVPGLIFAYGTLHDPVKQQELFGRVIAGTSDSLDNYATTEIVEDGETYLAAVSKDGGVINGFVFEVAPADLEAADAWEGGQYRRVQLPLQSGVTAWVYVKASST